MTQLSLWQLVLGHARVIVTGRELDASLTTSGPYASTTTESVSAAREL